MTGGDRHPSVGAERCATGANPSAGPTRTMHLAMPHLGPAGLSENWVLKEAGAAHWAAITEALSTRSSDLTDRIGNRLYASFVLAEVRGPPLSRFVEDMPVAMSTRLSKISERRFHSLFQLRSVDAAAIAEVELLSIFIRRRQADDNRSIGAEAPTARHDADIAPDARALAWADGIRRHDHDLLDLADAQDSGRYRVIRYFFCPSLEFNNAGLLYFANFQYIIDYGEWQAYPELNHYGLSTVNRKLRYFGNVDRNDHLLLLYRREDNGEQVQCIECLVYRASDGRLLARSHVIKHVM